MATTTAPTERPGQVPQPIPSEPGIPLPPDSISYRLKRRLLGAPLHSEELEHQRLGKPTALAVFASDNLSSSAYATEEILHVLLPVAGVIAFSLVMPITIAMCVVLGFLILSYRETIKEYPSAGGAYLVTKDNFGPTAAQVAGASLLIDYILTVAVSSAAGTAALTSAFDALEPYRVPIALFFIALVAFGNLRGVKESGRIFAVPTYFFMVSDGAAPRHRRLEVPGRRPARLLGGDRGGPAHPRGRGAERRGPAAGREALRRAPRVRLGRRGRHRRRGDLERRAGVPQARVAQRPADAGDHGRRARRHVPRPVGPGGRDPRAPVRERHAHGDLPDRRGRVRRRGRSGTSCTTPCRPARC